MPTDADRRHPQMAVTYGRCHVGNHEVRRNVGHRRSGGGEALSRPCRRPSRGVQRWRVRHRRRPARARARHYHPADGGLAHALAEQWPAYAAYVVSFLTIGIIWINHHAVMANLAAVNRTVLLLNLALLGWVSLIPWPTQLTAEYMRTGGADERTATLVYAGVMAAMGMTFGALWRYATNGRRLVVDSLTDAGHPAQLDPLPDRRPGVRGRDGGRPRQCAGQPGDHGGLAIYYLLPAGGSRPPADADHDDERRRDARLGGRSPGTDRHPPAGCHPPRARVHARTGRDPR